MLADGTPVYATADPTASIKHTCSEGQVLNVFSVKGTGKDTMLETSGGWVLRSTARSSLLAAVIPDSFFPCRFKAPTWYRVKYEGFDDYMRQRSHLRRWHHGKADRGSGLPNP